MTGMRLTRRMSRVWSPVASWESPFSLSVILEEGYDCLSLIVILLKFAVLLACMALVISFVLLWLLLRLHLSKGPFQKLSRLRRQ